MGSPALRLVPATVAVGVAAGLASIAFHFLADHLAAVLFHGVEVQTPAARALRVLTIPTAGLALVGLVLNRFPAARVGGVREVHDALADGRDAGGWGRVANVVLGGLVLAFGGSVGPEGPMVQMGALLGGVAGRCCGVAPAGVPTIVRAGAAAGIAAAFRSPAGAVLLTVEVLEARFDRGMVAISTAAVLGYLVRGAVLGDAPPFAVAGGVAPASLPLLMAAPLLGLAGAPAGDVFVRSFERFKTVFPRRWPLAFRVALGGLLVGALGVFFPEVMSAGYPVVQGALQERFSVAELAALFVLKMLATCITFGSGAVGGLFAPTLVMGALFGGVFGYGLHALWPAAAPQPEAFVLLGMIVMFGAVVKGYWSGFLMVADLSGAYHGLLAPGLLAGGVAFLLGWQLHHHSIFGLPAAWDGRTPATADGAQRRRSP